MSKYVKAMIIALAMIIVSAPMLAAAASTQAATTVRSVVSKPGNNTVVYVFPGLMSMPSASGVGPLEQEFAKYADVRDVTYNGPSFSIEKISAEMVTNIIQATKEYDHVVLFGTSMGGNVVVDVDKRLAEQAPQVMSKIVPWLDSTPSGTGTLTWGFRYFGMPWVCGIANFFALFGITSGADQCKYVSNFAVPGTGALKGHSLAVFFGAVDDGIVNDPEAYKQFVSGFDGKLEYVPVVTRHAEYANFMPAWSSAIALQMARVKALPPDVTTPTVPVVSPSPSAESSSGPSPLPSETPSTVVPTVEPSPVG